MRARKNYVTMGSTMLKVSESKKTTSQRWTRYHRRSTRRFTGSMGSFYFPPPLFEPLTILTENINFNNRKDKKFQISPKTPQNCPRSRLKFYRNTIQHVRGKPTTVMKPMRPGSKNRPEQIRLSLTKPTPDEFYISRLLLLHTTRITIHITSNSVSHRRVEPINIPHALSISSFPPSGNEEHCEFRNLNPKREAEPCLTASQLRGTPHDIFESQMQDDHPDGNQGRL